MSELDKNKIIAYVVEDFLKDAFKEVKSKAVDQLKTSLDMCFKEYIKKSYDRYSKMKTLLYRDQPVPLKSFYVRTDLAKGNEFSSNKKTIKEKDFITEFTRNKRVVVTGTAGSGKSTFCKSIFLDMIENPKGIFPLFIELRQLNYESPEKNITLFDYVFEIVRTAEEKLTQKQFEEAFKQGKILLILDGFDEINNELRTVYEKQIMHLINKYPNLLVLVSSRTENRFTSWELFYEYNILPLDKKKAISLIEKLQYDQTTKENFIIQLDRHLFEKHKDFTSNPLLLTMLLLTFDQIAEIPTKMHLFYEQAFETLFNKHDSSKCLYKRKSHSGLPIDDFKKVLSAFCIFSYSNKEYTFKEQELRDYMNKAKQISLIDFDIQNFIDDLLISVCILQKDGLDYTFTHRSFQEYFTALFLIHHCSTNRFDIFEKISQINDAGNVMSMVFDINQNFLEKEWIVPSLKKIFSFIPENSKTLENKFKILSVLFVSIFPLQTFDGTEIAFAQTFMNNIIHMICDLYSGDFGIFLSMSLLDYIQSNREQSEKATRQIVRIDFEKTGRNRIDLKKYNQLSNATKKRISQIIRFKFVLRQIEFLREKLKELEAKHSKLEKDLNELLFQ